MKDIVTQGEQINKKLNMNNEFEVKPTGYKPPLLEITELCERGRENIYHIEYGTLCKEFIINCFEKKIT